MTTETDIHERRVTITRLIDAPVDVVFAAWIEPEQVKQWWGPRHFTTPECEMDVRVGGRLYMVMKGPEGPGFPMDGEFVEIVPNRRLVFTNRPLGPNGKPLADGVTTVDFREVDGKTELSIDFVTRTAWRQVMDGMDQGCNEQTDKLVEYLESL